VLGQATRSEQAYQYFYNVYYQILQFPINVFNDIIQNAGILIGLDKHLSNRAGILNAEGAPRSPTIL
jgi:hypothetical protein